MRTRELSSRPSATIRLVKERQLPRSVAKVSAALRVPLLAEVGVGPNWDQAH